MIMNIFSSTAHLLLLASTWDVCAANLHSRAHLLFLLSLSDLPHTHHTHLPLHACLAMAIRQKFNNVPWQKLCQKPKTGYVLTWVCVLKNAMEICLVIIFVKNISQRLFQRPKIGTRHVYVFSNMQWHSSLACLCKNSHNGERVKWLTPANCVVRYSPRFVHAYALAGDTV